SAGVQRVVKAGELLQHPPGEDHVASGAEHACSAGIGGNIHQGRAEANAIEVRSEAAYLLEENLSSGIQLQRQHRSRESSGIRIRPPCVPETFEPTAIYRDVVIQEGDPVRRGFANSAIASEVESGLALNDIADTWEVRNYSRGPVIEGRIIDHQDANRAK